jgi:hypothetical protein
MRIAWVIETQKEGIKLKERKREREREREIEQEWLWDARWNFKLFTSDVQR